MWISVVLIILVIVIGLIAGSRLSAPGPQRRAVNASFISLAVMAALFFILINAFPGDWIVPFFTVACIVVPICIYVGFTRAAVSIEKAARKKSFEIPRAITTWDDEEEVAAPAPIKTATPAPAAQAKAKAKPVKAKPAPAPAPTAPAKPKPAAAPAKSSQPEAAPKPKQQTSQQVSTPVPSAAAVPAKAEAKPKAEPKTTPQKTKAAEPAPMPKPQVAPESKEEKAAVPSKPQTPKTVTPEAPAEKTAPTAASKAPRKAQPKPQVAEEIQASLTAKSTQATAQPKPEPAAEFTAAASTELLTGKNDRSDADVPVAKSLIAEIEALVERDLNVGRKIAEGASDEEVRAAESAPLQYHEGQQAPSASAGFGTSQTSKESAGTPSAQATEPKASSPQDSFTEFCNKATALRDRGSYAVAAIIFNKAAAAAPSLKDARTAQFDELSCYVKAGDAAKAKALAAQLRQSSVLTRFERIKLDAVERMS